MVMDSRRKENSVTRILGKLISKKEKGQGLLNDNTTEESCEDNRNLAIGYYNEGTKRFVKKEWKKAREEFKKGIRALEKIPPEQRTDDDYRCFAVNYHNVGACHHHSLRFEKALKNFIAGVDSLEKIRERTERDVKELNDYCLRVSKVANENGFKQLSTAYDSKAKEFSVRKLDNKEWLNFNRYLDPDNKDDEVQQRRVQP